MNHANDVLSVCHNDSQLSGLVSFNTISICMTNALLTRQSSHSDMSVTVLHWLQIDDTLARAVAQLQT